MEQEPKSAGVGRPRVVVSVGTSVDGRVALRRGQLWSDEDIAREIRSSQAPSTPTVDEARTALIDKLYHPEAVLEGSSSFVRDSAGPLTGLSMDFDDPPDVLYTDFLPDEVVKGPDHKMWLTAVDSRGRVHWDTKRAGGWDVLVLVARATPVAYLAYLRKERIPYLVVGEERVDLPLAVRRLQDRLGVTCLLSTAGGALNGALLRAGLIDEIHLLVSPHAIGGTDTPTLFDGTPLARGASSTPLRLLFAHVETDGTLWLRYEVIREDPSDP